MRGFAKENRLLLGVMLVSATAVLSYFPFLTTNLGGFTGIRSDYIPLILAIGIITGNALAYPTSLAAKDQYFVALLKSAYALASVSILMLVLCRGARLPVAVAFVAVSAFPYRYSISLAGNVVRALHLGQHRWCRGPGVGNPHVADQWFRRQPRGLVVPGERLWRRFERG